MLRPKIIKMSKDNLIVIYILKEKDFITGYTFQKIRAVKF